LELGRVLELRWVLELRCELELRVPGGDGLQPAGQASRRRDPAVGRGCPRCDELTDAFHE
jgi:hypothetical protein